MTNEADGPRREWIPRGPSDHEWGEPVALWTRSFVLLMGANFCMAMVFYLFMPTMAQYATEEFGASPAHAGLTTGMLIIGAVVARVFAGKFLDVAGRKKLMLAAIAVQAVFSAAQAVAGSLLVLDATRFVAGLGFGAASTALAASVQGIIPPRRRGEGTGWFGMSAVLATALGPMTGLLVAHAVSLRASFLVGTAFCLLGLVFALGVRLPRVQMTPEQRAAAHSFHPREIVETSAVPIGLMMLLLGTAYSGILAFLGQFTAQEGFGEAASMFFLVYAAVTLAGRPVAGRLLDRRGENVVMYPALLALAGSLAVLSSARSSLAVIAAAALCGLGFGVVMSSGQAVVAALAARHRIGLATSTFFLLLDVGTGVGPVLLGAVAASVGFRGMYLALAVLVLLAAPLYHLLHGRRALGPLAALHR